MKTQENFNTIRESDSLSANDVEAILDVIGTRCRAKTINRLRSILNYGKSTIGHYGILNRLMKESDGSWSYCAGQDYPSEIRTIRELILKGGK